MNKFQQAANVTTGRHARVLKKGAAMLAATVAAAVSHAGAPQPADPAAAPARVKAPAAARPVHTAAPTCIGEIGLTAGMRVAEGKSAMVDLTQLRLPAPAWLRAVGDPEIVQMEPLTSAAPRNMFFAFGKKVGATNLMFQNREGRCAMVEINVGIDAASVQASIHDLMPSETNVRVSAAADSLVLNGTATDASAVDRIMSIASAYVRKPGGAAVQDRIVNMMSVGAPQQVMLEVKVAEISRSLLDKVGGGLSAATGSGSWTATLLAGFTAGAAGGVRLDKGGNVLQLDAERNNALVKILAEPTVMAISGQDGSFLAGGRIFIPVAQDSNGKVTLEEKEFGVGLRFTPTVLDGGRINLKVAPEVSELARSGIGISSSGTGGNAVLPLITTRRAATTVQLFDGQSFVIGGLLKNNVTENMKALPILGEVPVLGALFRSSDFQADRTELVFIVTPRLVKPLPASYPLPTDRFTEPSRAEFFLDGRMEAAGKRSTAQVAPAAPNAASSTALTGFELK